MKLTFIDPQEKRFSNTLDFKYTHGIVWDGVMCYDVM